MVRIFSLLSLLLMGATAWALPFVPTTNPADPSTHWYQIKTGSLYVYVASGVDAYLDATSTASTDDHYLWCFVGDNVEGYKIFNRGLKLYMSNGFEFSDGTDRYVSHYEAASGNTFYISYIDRYSLSSQKMYLCCDYNNGMYGTSTKHNTYTVAEVAVEQPTQPYTFLTPYAYHVPHNYLQNEGNEGYRKLLDNDNTTKWCVVNCSGDWEPIWVDFQSDVPFIPTRYALTTGGDTQFYPNRNPKEWTLYAKANANAEWTVLAKVTDGNGLGTQNTTDYYFFIPDGKKAYRFFRFEVSKINGIEPIDGNNTFQLAELRLTGEPVKPITGDVNADGEVDVADINAEMNIMLGKATSVSAADVNTDGSIDVADVNKLINIMLGKDTPAENPPEDKSFTVNGVQFKMIAVQGGTFSMGASADDSFAYSFEKPAHRVTLSHYLIGQTEVTQNLWNAVMGKNPSSNKASGSNPVENVSWNNCQTFINKLNDLTGEVFRLPTEAEWEYAARGGRKTNGYIYAGANYPDDVAWYRGTTYGQSVHEVATKSPNELGIYDMSGNVSEWCSDFYAYYSSDAQTNPTGPETGSTHVVRGGNWADESKQCRVTFRDYKSSTTTSSAIGLRLALPVAK